MKSCRDALQGPALSTQLTIPINFLLEAHNIMYIRISTSNEYDGFSATTRYV